MRENGINSQNLDLTANGVIVTDAIRSNRSVEQERLTARHQTQETDGVESEPEGKTTNGVF